VSAVSSSGLAGRVPGDCGTCRDRVGRRDPPHRIGDSGRSGGRRGGGRRHGTLRQTRSCGDQEADRRTDRPMARGARDRSRPLVQSRSSPSARLRAWLPAGAVHQWMDVISCTQHTECGRTRRTEQALARTRRPRGPVRSLRTIDQAAITVPTMRPRFPSRVAPSRPTVT